MFHFRSYRKIKKWHYNTGRRCSYEEYALLVPEKILSYQNGYGDPSGPPPAQGKVHWRSLGSAIALNVLKWFLIFNKKGIYGKCTRFRQASVAVSQKLLTHLTHKNAWETKCTAIKLLLVNMRSPKHLAKRLIMWYVLLCSFIFILSQHFFIFQVRDTKGHILAQKEDISKGKFSFTSELYDTFEICFISQVPSSKYDRWYSWY